jgi:hypothetical protein
MVQVRSSFAARDLKILYNIELLNNFFLLQEDNKCSVVCIWRRLPADVVCCVDVGCIRRAYRVSVL